MERLACGAGCLFPQCASDPARLLPSNLLVIWLLSRLLPQMWVSDLLWPFDVMECAADTRSQLFSKSLYNKTDFIGTEEADLVGLADFFDAHMCLPNSMVANFQFIRTLKHEFSRWRLVLVVVNDGNHIWLIKCVHDHVTDHKYEYTTRIVKV